MNRAAATTLLTTEYQELVVDAKFTTQQTTDAYNLALDMSLRQLGYQESDLPTADVLSPILSYIALMHYFTLKRFSRLLSVRFDVEITGALKASRSQAFAQVEKLLIDAEMECINLGFQVGGISAFQMGRITLDFMEPDFLGGTF